MHAPPRRRATVCLFCAATARARPNLRLLPRIQAVHRSDQRNHVPDERKPVRYTRSRRDYWLQPTFESKYRDDFRSQGNGQFFNLLREALESLRTSLATPEFLPTLGLSPDQFSEKWTSFERSVSLMIRTASSDLAKLTRGGSVKREPLESRLRHLFYNHAFGGSFTKAELDNQKLGADLRYPEEWYPSTREIPRIVHLHVGPTNSGKTYHALKRLEEVDRGIYLGPLRLLAHEVFTRLNAKGKPCGLLTGEEQRIPDGANPEDVRMLSCTVEMAPLNAQFDVAVIDEIQMISHMDRGWAWTQAFLGIQAKEIHLCGEARTVPLMRQLCALIGDQVHVHEYERLTPLEVARESLKGDLTKLQKGDCIVAFSVLGLHALRRQVERTTGKKCAIVYGSLPPETRAQQARLFNDPDNDYDFLVASDAIGMGLNLSVKRIIFESVVKNNGRGHFVPLQISEVKQIGGRAGRYRTAHQEISDHAGSTIDPAIGLDAANSTPVVPQESAVQTSVGLVTTLEAGDFSFLRRTMPRDPEPIVTAGLFPPSGIVERFASYFPPATPFSYILLRLHEISEMHPRFHLCALKDQLAIADAIHTVRDLTVADRLTFCAAPANMREATQRSFMQDLAHCVGSGTSGQLLDLPNLPLEVLDTPPSEKRTYLWKLEELHKMLVTYLWLSYRFPNVFVSRGLANHVKLLTEEAIETTLSKYSWSGLMARRQQLRREKSRQALQHREEEEGDRRFTRQLLDHSENLGSEERILPTSAS